MVIGKIYEGELFLCKPIYGGAGVSGRWGGSVVVFLEDSLTCTYKISYRMVNIFSFQLNSVNIVRRKW